MELSAPSASPKREKLTGWQIAQRVFAVLAAIAITVFIIGIRDTIGEYAIYGYPGVFVISLLGNATLILPAPSFAIVFAVGGALNPYLTGIAAGCGAALGEMTGYLAGLGGRGVMEDKAFHQRLEALMTQYGAWLVFALAVIPNPAFDVGGILAGALRMPWWKFLAAAAAGKSIRFIVLAMFGASILG